MLIHGKWNVFEKNQCQTDQMLHFAFYTDLGIYELVHQFNVMMDSLHRKISFLLHCAVASVNTLYMLPINKASLNIMQYFQVSSCNIFYVNICPLRILGVENKSWLGSIFYIQFVIQSRTKSFIPLCISINVSCKVPPWLGLLANNTFQAMKQSLKIM